LSKIVDTTHDRDTMEVCACGWAYSQTCWEGYSEACGRYRETVRWWTYEICL